jgi:hypothetical protein
MERFAANYVYLPEYGFLKQYVVERAGDNIRLFPLVNEIEAVSWVSGIICLVALEKEKKDVLRKSFFSNKQVLPGVPNGITLNNIQVIQLSPFDFTCMQTLDNTQLTVY